MKDPCLNCSWSLQACESDAVRKPLKMRQKKQSQGCTVDTAHCVVQVYIAPSLVALKMMKELWKPSGTWLGLTGHVDHLPESFLRLAGPWPRVPLGGCLDLHSRDRWR